MSRKAKVTAGILVSFFLVTAGLAISFRLASGSSNCCRDAAVKNMRQIQEWKKTWVLENKKGEPEHEGLWRASASIRTLKVSSGATNGSMAPIP